MAAEKIVLRKEQGLIVLSTILHLEACATNPEKTELYNIGKKDLAEFYDFKSTLAMAFFPV